MFARIGYAVLAYNQAGGPPTFPSMADLHYDRADAEDDKTWRENNAAMAGRYEQYRVCEIFLDGAA